MNNLEIIRGDTVDLALDFGTSIENAVVFFTAKANLTDADDDAVLKTEVDVHDDAINGLTTVRFNAADTDALEPGTYFYDIQVKYSDGAVESWKHSKMVVIADVTRRTA
jgi:hypothetical protein